MSAQQFRSSRILFEKENQDLNRLNAKHHLTTPSSSSPFKGSDTEGETEPSPSPSPFIPRFERFDTFDISPSKTLAPSPPPSSSSNTFSNSHSSSNSPSNSPLSCVKSLFFTKETPVSPKKQRGGGARGRVDKRKSWGSLNGQVPNQNRYETEFKQIRLLGTGAFGEVYQCENRIDGCTYAIKKSKRPITGKLDEKSALREVHAHATLSSLGVHENIVRYYSVWKENNYLYLQNEFCNGGGITKQDYDESQLLDIMKQIASGLKFLHDRGFVHLDIKPGNIFICTIAPPKSQKNEGNDKPKDQILYKIGDFGHVRSFGGQGGEKHTSEDGSVKIQEDDDESSEIDLEEGDCCYIAREILSFDKQFDQQQLPAADIFSLAISIYELVILFFCLKKKLTFLSFFLSFLSFLSFLFFLFFSFFSFFSFMYKKGFKRISSTKWR